MGLFDALLGNANAVDREKVAAKLDGILLPDEVISLAYKLVRDFFVFTEKRMLIVDIQGITGKKVDYLSIPYRSVIRYSLETAAPLTWMRSSRSGCPETPALSSVH